jgi:hypothetical protein
VKLGFKTAPSGKRRNNFARIQIEVDGEILDFLLDTGGFKHSFQRSAEAVQ